MKALFMLIALSFPGVLFAGESTGNLGVGITIAASCSIQSDRTSEDHEFCNGVSAYKVVIETKQNSEGTVEDGVQLKTIYW